MTNKLDNLMRKANEAALKVGKLTAALEKAKEAYAKAHNAAASYAKTAQTVED